jgi:hypothetical protein
LTSFIFKCNRNYQLDLWVFKCYSLTTFLDEWKRIWHKFDYLLKKNFMPISEL